VCLFASLLPVLAHSDEQPTDDLAPGMRPIPVGESERAFPRPGSRVRVHSAAATVAPLVGTLTISDQKSITIAPADGSEPKVLARLDISRLERSVRQSHKGRGAVIGLGVGFAVGLAGTFALCFSFGTSCPMGEGLVYGTIYGAAVGALGAGVGAAGAPGEQWEDVPLSSVRSGNKRQQPPMGVRWAIAPLVGHRRGFMIVASF
jgi:hypothetical protein